MRKFHNWYSQSFCTKKAWSFIKPDDVHKMPNKADWHFTNIHEEILQYLGKEESLSRLPPASKQKNKTHYAKHGEGK